ncbi:MAG: hypothetical protein V3T83_22305 [Acidobacteriota bacterium]
MRKNAILSACLTLAAMQWACSDSNGSDSGTLREILTQASQANVRHDVKAEESFLRKALSKSGTDRERAEAP